MLTDGQLARLIKANLSDDLRKPKYRGSSNRLKGHCYVASEAFFHLCGAKTLWTPGTLKHEGDTHWVLRNRQSGKIVDITAKQFTTVPDYDSFRGRGFLTKKPSKRTKFLINKIMEKKK